MSPTTSTMVAFSTLRVEIFINAARAASQCFARDCARMQCILRALEWQKARTLIPGEENSWWDPGKNLSRGDRREYSCEDRTPYKPGEAAKSFAQDRAASLPIARSIPKSAGWRKARGTWSPENPSTGRSVPYKNPHSDRGGVSRNIRPRAQSARTRAQYRSGDFGP